MSLDLLGGLFVGAAISGVLPLVNAELLVMAAAAAVPGGAVLVLALVTTAGQMVTKTGLYGLARWAPDRLPEKARKALGRASARLEARQGAAGTTVLASAALGFPPFYGVSLACGVLRVRLRTFLLPGTAGRFVRFAALAWGGKEVGAEVLDTAARVLGPLTGFGG